MSDPRTEGGRLGASRLVSAVDLTKTDRVGERILHTVAVAVVPPAEPARASRRVKQQAETIAAPVVPPPRPARARASSVATISAPVVPSSSKATIVAPALGPRTVIATESSDEEIEIPVGESCIAPSPLARAHRGRRTPTFDQLLVVSAPSRAGLYALVAAVVSTAVALALV